jgi:hypothetical protein
MCDTLNKLEDNLLVTVVSHLRLPVSHTIPVHVIDETTAYIYRLQLREQIADANGKSAAVDALDIYDLLPNSQKGYLGRMTSINRTAAQTSAPLISKPQANIIAARSHLENTSNRLALLHIHSFLDPELILKYRNLYDPFSLLAALQLEFLSPQHRILSKDVAMDMARGVGDAAAISSILLFCQACGFNPNSSESAELVTVVIAALWAAQESCFSPIVCTALQDLACTSTLQDIYVALSGAETRRDAFANLLHPTSALYAGGWVSVPPKKPPEKPFDLPLTLTSPAGGQPRRLRPYRLQPVRPAVTRSSPPPPPQDYGYCIQTSTTSRAQSHLSSSVSPLGLRPTSRALPHLSGSMPPLGLSPTSHLKAPQGLNPASIQTSTHLSSSVSPLGLRPTSRALPHLSGSMPPLGLSPTSHLKAPQGLNPASIQSAYLSSPQGPSPASSHLTPLAVLDTGCGPTHCLTSTSLPPGSSGTSQTYLNVATATGNTRLNATSGTGTISTVTSSGRKQQLTLPGRSISSSDFTHDLVSANLLV